MKNSCRFERRSDSNCSYHMRSLGRMEDWRGQSKDRRSKLEWRKDRKKRCGQGQTVVTE